MVLTNVACQPCIVMTLPCGTPNEIAFLAVDGTADFFFKKGSVKTDPVIPNVMHAKAASGPLCRKL